MSKRAKKHIEHLCEKCTKFGNFYGKRDRLKMFFLFFINLGISLMFFIVLDYYIVVVIFIFEFLMSVATRCF